MDEIQMFREKYQTCENNRQLCEGQKKLIMVLLKSDGQNEPKIICNTNNRLLQTNEISTKNALNLTSKSIIS